MGKVCLNLAALNKLNEQRKRKINVGKTKDSVLKALRTQGKAYPDRKLGQALITPAISPPSPQQICKCHKEGCQLDAATKLNLFEQFRNQDTIVQAMILVNSIVLTTPKQRKNAVGPVVKEFTYKYQLMVNGIRKEACRATILDVFGVTVSRLTHVIEEMKLGKLVPEDRRGVHENRPRKVPEEVRRDIRQHIQVYRTYESHYHRARAAPNTRYLSPDLNLSIMYDQFLQSQRNQGRLECEQWFYHSIFNQEYSHLKFCVPKTDTCDECDGYQASLLDATQVEAVRITQSQSLHHLLAEQAYDAHKADAQKAKGDPSYVVFTVDLQKVIFTPQLRSSSCFYLRRYSNYNLAITSASDGASHMHLWTEAMGSRGSNEISSAIWKFITSNYQPIQLDRTLVIWMDRCIGQNNNTILLSLMQRIADWNYFSSVEQKFFFTGHSYNACDRAFGVIENKIRMTQLECPNQIEEVIRTACTENPFHPVRLSLKDFLDFKTRSTLLKFPRTFRVTHQLVYKIVTNQPNCILMKTSHDPAELWNLIKVNYNRHQHSFLALTPCRTETIKLERSKLKDLQKILPLLSGESFAYYSALIDEELLRQ